MEETQKGAPAKPLAEEEKRWAEQIRLHQTKVLPGREESVPSSLQQEYHAVRGTGYFSLRFLPTLLVVIAILSLIGFFMDHSNHSGDRMVVTLDGEIDNRVALLAFIFSVAAFLFSSILLGILRAWLHININLMEFVDLRKETLRQTKVDIKEHSDGI
jgi:hypothetical protein